jgi:hypothetical protein
MVPVRGPVAVLATTRSNRGGGGLEVRYGFVGGRGGDVVCRPEELGCLEEHLDDVFIAVIAGGNPRVVGKEEDVHPTAGGGGCGCGGQFFTRGR